MFDNRSETSLLAWRERDMKIRCLIEERRKILLNHKKYAINHFVRDIKLFLLEKDIQCSDEEARAIMEDIIVSGEYYDNDCLISRNFLQWAYDYFPSELRCEEMEDHFHETLWRRMLLIRFRLARLKLKEIMPLVSVLFYDGIEPLYKTSEEYCLDGERSCLEEEDDGIEPLSLYKTSEKCCLYAECPCLDGECPCLEEDDGWIKVERRGLKKKRLVSKRVLS